MSFSEFQTILHRVCASNSWELHPRGEAFQVQITVGTQKKDVLVTFADDSETGEMWARFWSEGCRAGILDADFLLRLNGEDRFLTGCVALKKEHIVVVDSQLTSTADELEIRSCLWNTAKFALAIKRLASDAMEGKGTGKFVRGKLLENIKDLPRSD